MTWHVRGVADPDLKTVADIVNHYILDGVIHFSERPQTAEDWRVEWQLLYRHYPWLVAEQNGVIGGLAYAKPYNDRAAYDWTAEVTIYLRDGYTGQGLGRALYARLFEILDAQGYRVLVAGITLPNPASVRLHESFGFAHLGTLERVGYKQGAWHDVGLWQRRHAHPGDGSPEPIVALDQLPGA